MFFFFSFGCNFSIDGAFYIGKDCQLFYVIDRFISVTWLRKGILKRKTESLQRAAQNNVIRTSHIQARTDKTQQNSKCRLCGDRDETINHLR